MTQFHPDINWLVDFSSGSMPLANALCVSAHLEYCGRCRQRVAELNALGGSLMKNGAGSTAGPVVAAEEPVSASILDAVFSAIDACENQTGEVPVAAAQTPAPRAVKDSSGATGGKLPSCLDKLLPQGIDKLNWQKLGSGLKVARLGAGDEKCEVALHRLSAGGGVANHDHRGEEVTVVLQGSFSDRRGLYLPGDFIVMGQGDQHRPIASKDMDCLCLASVEAPICFTGPFARMLNPFLRVQPGA
ncbi:MAG: ChrR family anti-sigma-E factor [Pseudomonadales bacterium]